MKGGFGPRAAPPSGISGRRGQLLGGRGSSDHRRQGVRVGAVPTNNSIHGGVTGEFWPCAVLKFKPGAGAGGQLDPGLQGLAPEGQAKCRP